MGRKTKYPEVSERYLHNTLPREEYPVCPRCKTNKWMIYYREDAIYGCDFVCWHKVDDKWGGKKRKGNKCWYHASLYKKKDRECRICGTTENLLYDRRICETCYKEYYRKRDKLARKARKAKRILGSMCQDTNKG